jgi:hypothetical protein
MDPRRTEPGLQELAVNVACKDPRTVLRVGPILEDTEHRVRGGPANSA